jgi:hypothetical protein
MNKIRPLTVGAAVLAVCLSAAREADACSCVLLPHQSDRQLRNEVLKALKTVDAVFTAEAVATDMLATTLQVEKVWKGTIGDQVRLRHATRMADGMLEVSSCDIGFTVGKSYVVFAVAVAESGGVMVADYCGSTVTLDAASKTLLILGPPLENRDDRKGLH